MPNYVTNKVSINSDKETINKIKKDYFERKNDKGETLPFSFQFIKQRPESLDIEEGSKTNLGIEYVNGTEEEKKSVIQRVKAFEMKLDEVIKLGEQAVENKKKYGHHTWYGWCKANWGTKWDAINVQLLDVTETKIEFTFETAWSEPRPIYEEIVKKYPNIELEIDYANEDLGCDCGSIYYFDGIWEYVNQDEDFARELWGWGYDDEEDEE